jgi:hypothetical protein
VDQLIVNSQIDISDISGLKKSKKREKCEKRENLKFRYHGCRVSSASVGVGAGSGPACGQSKRGSAPMQ